MSPTLAGQRARLRADFDRSFAAPPPPPQAGFEDLLAVRVGGDPYAVRLAEVAALVVDRPPTPLPGALPELRGLVGVRGTVIPAYDLAALLGYAAPATTPRWLVVAAGAPTLGLAVDHLDGHLRVRRDDDAPVPERRTAFVADVVATDGGARPVLDIAAVRAAITARAAPDDHDRNG